MEIIARTPSTVLPVAINVDAIQDRAFGFTAATLISGGFGVALFGALTLIAELFVKSTTADLTLVKSVGPLSGKAIYAVIGWLVGYALPAFIFRCRNISGKATYWITGIFVAIGFVLIFPTTWKLLGA